MNSPNSLSPQTSLASDYLAKELWISLSSLLRSHVTMRSLAQPAADLRIISSSDSLVELKSYRRNLSISSPEKSGAGAIEFNTPGKNKNESGSYFFTEDGLIHFEDSGVEGAEKNVTAKGMELEAAVEELLDKVCQ
jgi:hypothetical protein